MFDLSLYLILKMANYLLKDFIKLQQKKKNGNINISQGKHICKDFIF